MEKYGYDRRYSTAVICAAGFLGYLIPPSIPVLIYCFIAQQSIAALFLATVIPGIILAIAYLIIIYFTSNRWIHAGTRVEEVSRGAAAYFKELGQRTVSSIAALFCPLIVLGGIYGGIFTPNEAASVGVVYSAIVGVSIYRGLNLKSGWQALKDTVSALGMLSPLVFFAVIFTRTLVQEGAGQVVATFITSITTNPYILLLIIIVVLLILGMFIENISIMLVVTPLLMPLLKLMGFNLIHMGSMFVLAMGIALTTPPFADALFLGARIGNVPFHSLVRPLLPFLLFGATPVLLLVAYVPELSLWLPTLIVGRQIVFGIQ
jgi:tripartite ATP-independent transporter DctM subunit